ncbi:MAG: hypothetical protein IJJ19_01225 [Erysipelotrichaceae bacterium]|nr:hypothetical protein [Erysipelotrichaceae bacterium]
MKKEKPLGMRIGESAFCAGYLIFALIAGIIFASREGNFNKYCAVMTLLLGCGDAFHLIPRIIVNIRGESDNSNFWLGLGNLVSSITMTIFYILLFSVMKELKPEVTTLPYIRPLLIVLAVIRMALCLFPQNKWFTHEDNGNWGLYRNIPFVIMGIITVAYLLLNYHETLMAVLVIISFVCYMAVVLLAHKKPMMGMLMIPKTICYIWLIAILLGL